MNLQEVARKHGVTSLELSKELNEAGMPQDKSCYYWFTTSNTEPILVIKYSDECFVNVEDCDEKFPSIKAMEEDIWKCYSAFHSGELAEILPRYFVYNNIGYELYLEPMVGGGFAYRYIRRLHLKRSLAEWLSETFMRAYANTLPNALAKMWLYLKKKGLIE